MISVNVKLFGPLRDIVREESVTVELPDTGTGEEVFDKLAGTYPDLQKWKPSVLLAVNLEYVRFEHRIQAGDEISFIPPVSGG